LEPIFDPNVLVGAQKLDDAGVYKISEEIALVQTVDYFTPIVKDPYIFGQIAAANALSDVYAMGGKPITAMNIICFPAGSMDLSILSDILQGGSDKLKEAGVSLLGGHSLIDKSEVKYGLAVTGLVHPKKILTNARIIAGDKLILTKPIGTGILNNCFKKDLLDDKTEEEIIWAMTTLNNKSAEVALEVGVHACTDITGFGLIGHLAEMMEAGDVGIELNYASIPLFPRTEEFAERGIDPPGSQRNRKFREVLVEGLSELPSWKRWILFDAQTSGGLVFAVSPQKAEQLVKRLHQEGIKAACVIGAVVKEPQGKIVVQ
jgi:selenide,water dikinase